MEHMQRGHASVGSHQSDSNSGQGFSLLEMMTVVAIIMILASFAVPIFRNTTVRARETVLRDDLYTMRAMIDRFTLDNKRPPMSLEELVKAGYLTSLPVDPITHSTETWQVVMEDAPLAPNQLAAGIVDVHSGSGQISLEGTPYDTW